MQKLTSPILVAGLFLSAFLPPCSIAVKSDTHPECLCQIIKGGPARRLAFSRDGGASLTVLTKNAGQIWHHPLNWESTSGHAVYRNVGEAVCTGVRFFEYSSDNNQYVACNVQGELTLFSGETGSTLSGRPCITIPSSLEILSAGHASLLTEPSGPRRWDPDALEDLVVVALKWRQEQSHPHRTSLHPYFYRPSAGIANAGPEVDLLGAEPSEVFVGPSAQVFTLSKRKLTLWSLSKRKPLWSLSKAIRSFIYSPSGEQFLTVDNNGRIEQWSIAGEKIRELKSKDGITRNYVLSAYSADGKRIAALSTQAQIETWTSSDGVSLYRPVGLDPSVPLLARHRVDIALSDAIGDREYAVLAIAEQGDSGTARIFRFPLIPY